MNWKISLILILAVLIAIFILQNHGITRVNFLLWSLESNKAIILFLTLLAGIIMGGIISFVVSKEYKKTSG